MKPIYPTCQYIDLVLMHEILDGDHEIIQQVLHEFMDTVETDLPSMQEAYDQKDLDTVANIAHKFRSTFRYFGVRQYGSLPADLEILARSTKNRSAVKPVLAEFVQCCSRLQAEVQEVLKSFDTALPK